MRILWNTQKTRPFSVGAREYLVRFFVTPTFVGSCDQITRGSDADIYQSTCSSLLSWFHAIFFTSLQLGPKIVLYPKIGLAISQYVPSPLFTLHFNFLLTWIVPTFFHDIPHAQSPFYNLHIEYSLFNFLINLTVLLYIIHIWSWQ